MKTTTLKSAAKYFMLGIFALVLFTKLNGQNLSNDYVVGEVIVQLKSDITPTQLTQSFSNIGLTQKQKISDILNIWLFQYNVQSIQPDSCLSLLRRSTYVKTAQFNHYVNVNSVSTCFPPAPPIELLTFSVTLNPSNTVLIQWRTADETNNNFFTIERSQDGINYSSVGTVPGAINSTTPINYSFTDYTPVTGTNYYRLRQTDFDGSSVAFAPQSVVVPASCSNDPYFPFQWALQNVGQSGGTSGVDIKACQAWGITTGGTTVQNDQIIIAIVDVGFDINHEDITFWKNTAEIPNNGIDDDGNGFVDDYDGWNTDNNNGIITSALHGTHVAGIAGAKGNNSKGIAGINWNAQIMPIQISSSSITESKIVTGYSYILKMRQLYNQTNGSQGAFVVVTNASFSTHTKNVSPDDYPIWCGMYDALGAEGILNVNGPWNLDQEIGTDFNDIPAMCSSEYLIVVTNTDNNDNLYDENSFNHNGSPYSKTYVDLAAPGTDIYSTLPGNSYGTETGTSMAAPYVAGAIALMYSAACNQFITSYKSNPSAGALAIKQFLYNGSDPIYSLLLKIGYGRLNVYKSIIKMSEQFDYDLYVTGTETATSKQYDAIHDITVENYTAVGNHNITFRSGNSITFKPGTDLKPDPGQTIRAYIDKNTFDCAIPYQPLTVDLITPANPYCSSGHIPITCNAVPTGGKSPYSYLWSTKGFSSNNWTTHTVNNPNFIYFSTEDFYIQVQITDDRGITALSPIKFVDCLDARIANHIDSTSNSTSTHIESDNLRQSFNIFPNPSTGKVIISFTLAKASDVTIQINDNTGRKITDVTNKKHYEIGNNKIEFDTKDLSEGLYFYTITTNEGINALKLVVTK